MSLTLRTYSPFARVFNGLLSDLDHIDRGFTPYWRDNMGLDIGNELKEVTNDDEKFGVTIDVSHFKPEELKVNLDGRVLTIEANQEKNDGNSFFRRSFTRKWTVPEDVELTSLKSSLTSEGNLCIEAPKTGKASIRNIPIVPAIKN